MPAGKTRKFQSQHFLATLRCLRPFHHRLPYTFDWVICIMIYKYSYIQKILPLQAKTIDCFQIATQTFIGICHETNMQDNLLYFRYVLPDHHEMSRHRKFCCIGTLGKYLMDSLSRDCMSYTSYRNDIVTLAGHLHSTSNYVVGSFAGLPPNFVHFPRVMCYIWQILNFRIFIMQVCKRIWIVQPGFFVYVGRYL